MLLKRALDAVVAIVGMLALLPLVLLLPVLSKVDSAGPVFYRQMRGGLGAPIHDLEVQVYASGC